MAPSTQTAVAAAALAGCAFVLPSQSSGSKSSALRRTRTATAQAAQTSGRSQSGAAIGITLGALGAAVARASRNGNAKTTAKAFENELGVQPPLGFWDPAGLSSDGDPKEFYRRRVVETKHGRVAMLACTGYIVQQFVKFPGYLSPSSEIKFADVPNGLAGVTVVPAIGWFQYTIFCGICDLWLMHQVPTNPPGKLCTRLFGEETTNYEYGFLGLPGYLGGKAIADPEVKKKKLNAELANGRLAMMAIIGMFFQDGLTGSAWGDWANYTESPLRAFESELGVQPPVGFWDPLGFTKTDDAASFRRRRYVELKHGRVAMFACLGYIVPEYYRWPGDLSPSLGLKFSDVPTGFAAFSKVPLSGWAQIVAFAGTVELFQYVDDPKRPPGDFANAGFLGVPNSYVKAPAGTKEKKLAAEIANGRLAMMAIIGMFFQNGLTGEAWGDWSLYTDSPLRALSPAQEVIAGTGGPFPENFWDPAGITNGKSKEEILNLRAMELKHGRVAMLAVLGWFHVAAGYHIIGDYAVGEHLDNNPLVNLAQLPMGGAWQTVFTIMCLEWLTTYVCKPPAEKPWDILGWTDIIIEDEKSIWNQFRKAENQELNNGRLAMMGITGLIAQDVLFGDFGEAAVLPCFGAEACKELFNPVGPTATTEPFLGAGFIYPPLAM